MPNENDFAPLTVEQCLASVSKYGPSLTLWSKFWCFMEKQCKRGANYEYVKESANTLEITATIYNLLEGQTRNVRPNENAA